MKNKELIQRYIETVWNKQELNAIDEFISDEYQDHSFVSALPPNKEGLRIWIQNTSSAFKHHTKVESIVEEGDEVAVRISFHAKHIGTWRGISPTSREAMVKGFRFFKVREGRIVSHWALIDGEALQTALTEKYKGCELPI